LLNERDHFARLGVPAQFGFFKNRRAINRDLEAAAARRLQRDLDAGKDFAKRSRQTDGSWFVISDRTVFDIDNHFRSRAGVGS
jgi:hypothetical protein